MFSRFDNMMQHTHTHSRARKKGSPDLSEDIPSPMSVPEDNSTMHVSPMAILPQKNYMIDNHHRLLSPHSYFQTVQPSLPSEPYNSSSWRPIYYSPTTPHQFHHPVMMPPHSIPSPASQHINHQPQSPVSHTADYTNRRNSIDSITTQHKRRLSWIELSTPIQELGTTLKQDDSTDEEDDDDERQMSTIEANYTKTKFRYHGVDITVDEYEALQGFGKFCSEPVVRESIKLPPLNSFYSPQDFRQHISTIQESFQRGAH